MNSRFKNIAVIALTSCFIFGFLLWSVVSPDNAVSVSERRPLAQIPALSAKTVANGSFMADFEDYAADQFPMRDELRTVKAAASTYLFRRQDNNGIYIYDGYAVKIEYPLNVASIDRASARFAGIYERYMAENNVAAYFSVIPDKNYFLAQQSGHPSLDYDALTARFADGMSFASYIDIFDLLSADNYYRTDSHWRQETIEPVALRIAEAMGADVQAEFTLQSSDSDFYGVYYGQAALPLLPDTVCYLENDVINACTVYDHETGKYISVYNLDAAGGRDPYELFLHGSKALLTVENPNASSDKELIIFRDSFGSSLTPLLLSGYRTITLVDIRYLSPELLGQFITFDGQDVLFIYSAPLLNDSITLK